MIHTYHVGPTSARYDERAISSDLVVTSRALRAKAFFCIRLVLNSQRFLILQFLIFELSSKKQNQENPTYFLIFRIAEKQDQKKIAGMGLWTLLEGFLLLANALAILNEDRFLAPRGWSFSEVPGVRTKSLKGQVIGLIYATQYLRLPLMALNAITIIVMLVSG